MDTVGICESLFRNGGIDGDVGQSLRFPTCVVSLSLSGLHWEQP